MRGHPQMQRPNATVDEETVERSGHRADRVLDETEPLIPVSESRDDHAADDVGVAAQVLGGRMHHEVGAELERPLVDRGRKGVVDGDQRPFADRAVPGMGAWAALATAAMSTTSRRGLVGVSTQISLVSGLIAASQRSASVWSTSV